MIFFYFPRPRPRPRPLCLRIHLQRPPLSLNRDGNSACPLSFPAAARMLGIVLVRLISSTSVAARRRSRRWPPRDLACLSQLRRMARYSMCAQTIQGNPDSRVSSLVWCASSKSNSSGRLFSSSIDGSISEWDLFSLKQKKQRLETRIFRLFGVDQLRSLSAHCSLLFSAKISSSQKCPREVKHMSRLGGQTGKVDRIQEGEK